MVNKDRAAYTRPIYTRIKYVYRVGCMWAEQDGTNKKIYNFMSCYFT